MGAWDGTTFGNDTAADWAGELADSGSVAGVAEVLTQVAEAPAHEYLEAGPASEALAAAEVVAAALGRPVESSPYIEQALAWAASHPELAQLQSIAVRAAERVRAPESELAELWEEANDDDHREWKDAVADLLQRLQMPV